MDFLEIAKKRQSCRSYDEAREVEQEKLERFLIRLQSDLYRAKGFFRLAGKGWQQVDLVGRRIDSKPCSEKETAEMVFISKIGPAVIKKILTAWEEEVGVPMKLKN